MQLPHFDVHVHVEDVKIVIKLRFISKVHYVGLHYLIISECATQKIEFATARQAKQIYQCENIKGKLYIINTPMCYNKTYRQKQLIPNYIYIQGVPYM
jgi:CO/xanthine dehydrogenase Mo-binding subunit